MLRSLVQGLTCFTVSACRINSLITGKQQFFHTKFLSHMHHPGQAQFRVAKVKTQRTQKIHSQQLRTGTVALTGQMQRQAIYLNCGETISQSARKETALCGMPSQRSSIPFLKTREYQATTKLEFHHVVAILKMLFWILSLCTDLSFRYNCRIDLYILYTFV